MADVQSSDSITRTVDLAAAPERVWQALTDHREFGAWFRVALDDPFRVGEVSTGHITHPGYEHIRWEATVVAMDAPRRFAFTWHPYAVDPAVDYGAEEPTTVEFTLTPTDVGTQLTVTESGFGRLPAHRRDEALRMNAGGWTAQMDNIRAHVDG